MITQASRRPHSALGSSLQKFSARDLASRSWNLFTAEAYPSLRLMAGAFVLLTGGPGDGKSTMIARLLDSLAGHVVLYAAEEGASPSLAERLTRLNVRRSDFTVLSGGLLDDLVDELARLKPVALGIDSINVTHLVPVELRKLQSAAKIPLVFASQQLAKDGRAAGLNAWAHEGDAILSLSVMRWRLEKSRYQPPGLEGDVL